MNDDNDTEVREAVGAARDKPDVACAEERSANTTAGVATEPAGAGSGVDRVMPQWVVAALMVVAVVVGAVAAAGRPLPPRPGHRPAAGPDLAAHAARRRRRVARQPSRLLAIGLCTVIAAGAFVTFMGWVGGEL